MQLVVILTLSLSILSAVSSDGAMRRSGLKQNVMKREEPNCQCEVVRDNMLHEMKDEIFVDLAACNDVKNGQAEVYTSSANIEDIRAYMEESATCCGDYYWFYFWRSTLEAVLSMLEECRADIATK